MTHEFRASPRFALLVSAPFVLSAASLLGLPPRPLINIVGGSVIASLVVVWAVLCLRVSVVVGDDEVHFRRLVGYRTMRRGSATLTAGHAELLVGGRSTYLAISDGSRTFGIPLGLFGDAAADLVRAVQATLKPTPAPRTRRSRSLRRRR